MYDTPRTSEQILTMLAAAPVHLAGLTNGGPPDKLLTASEPGKWSARDVLAHLCACSDMWGKAIVEIFREDRPTLKAVNLTTLIKQTSYREHGFQTSLRAFTAQPADLLAALRPLASEAWSRMATVTGAGKPRERTVPTYALWLANHERSRYKQFERIANKLRLQQ